MQPMTNNVFRGKLAALAVFILAGLAGSVRGEGLDAVLTEFRADQMDVEATYDVPGSPAMLDRRESLVGAWLKRLDGLDYDSLSPAARIDWHLLHTHLLAEREDFTLQRARLSEMEPLIGFLHPLEDLLADHSARQNLDAEQAASALAAAADQLKDLRKRLGARPDAANALKPSSVLALRTAETLERLRGDFNKWYGFYDGFQPDFSWWLKQPHTLLDKELETTATYLRKDIAGLKGEAEDPLLGESIGRPALEARLAEEMIPYSPEELIAIADKEFAWCEAEMKKAATAMGCKDGAEALAKIKSRHVPPGGQAALAQTEASKAIRFVKDKGLVTIPPLAEETWGVSMLSVSAQKTLPYAVYGRPNIGVAFANEAMSHEEKEMAMRGNNSAFLHIVTPHELIPGHHLQGFMARRYATQRQMFSTPFLVEGWALHWEMLLWDSNYTATPEEKVGALFWRMHRCARVIVSLKFHLGSMSPQQMIDFLVERVGHERAGATSEVRRYIGDGYGPLYQAGYMVGGLQLRALYHDLTGSGKMSPREFHDRVLHEGPVSIEMIRAALTGAKLPKDWKPAWKFEERN